MDRTSVRPLANSACLLTMATLLGLCGMPDGEDPRGEDCQEQPPPGVEQGLDQPDYVIEPPDIIIVEVLEALPGRPITGERLVRPDGNQSRSASTARSMSPA